MNIIREQINKRFEFLIKFIFQAQTPMELSLVKGEMVTLTRRIDGNW